MTFDRAVAGDIFLTKIPGIGGKLIWLGQAINGDLSEWTHAGLVMPDGRLFEAQPGGAVLSHQDRYDGHPVRVLHRVSLSDSQRAMMIQIARGLEGSPYNWTTYFYLSAYRLHLPLTTRLLRKRVSRPNKMICSQAVDWIAEQAGDHLFSDGRKPHDVTPGDLARLGLPDTECWS
jgi:hypothetical protein